jgi:signal transduction histidine kinase
MMEQNIALRKSALRYGIPLGIAGGLLATIKAFYSFSDPIAFLLPLMMTILLIFYYILYRKNYNETIIAFLTLSTLFIELITKEQLTAVGMGIYFWIYIFPLAIFAFFSPLRSLILNIIFLSIFLWLHRDGVGFINKDYFLFPLAFSYLTITIFNFIYQRYQAKQTEVIAEKTKALNRINHSLEDKISTAIKESKEKEKVFEQQAKLAQMGELLSMISHQWRQPLGSIAAATISLKTKLELEKYDLSKEDEREKFLTYLMQKLDNIENYTSALSNTIDDFKNFYNPNKEITKASITISIKKAINIMQSSFDRHHILLEESYATKAEIEHYANEIMQVMLNILNNAVGNFKEQKTKDPKITIMIDEKDEDIIIEVCDNGGGIKKEIMEKIFNPYFSTKDEKNGTGLGLYMSKTIIEKHHQGVLTVSNRDGGACFSIKLPKKLST